MANIQLYPQNVPANFSMSAAAIGASPIWDLTQDSTGTGIDFQSTVQFANNLPVIFESQANAIECAWWNGSACILDPTYTACGGAIANCVKTYFAAFGCDNAWDGTPNIYKHGIFFIKNETGNPIYDLKIGFSDTNNNPANNKGNGGFKCRLFLEGMEAAADIRVGANVEKWAISIDKNTPGIPTPLKTKLTGLLNNETIKVAIFSFPIFTSGGEWPDIYTEPSSEDLTWDPMGNPSDIIYGYYENAPKLYHARLYLRCKY